MYTFVIIQTLNRKFLLLQLLINPTILDEIIYSVSFKRPYTHYCEVEISLNTAERNSIVFSMPVWTPGSYLVREFAKNVDEISAENFSGEKLPVEKNQQELLKADTSDQKNIRFKYKVVLQRTYGKDKRGQQ